MKKYKYLIYRWILALPVFLLVTSIFFFMSLFNYYQTSSYDLFYKEKKEKVVLLAENVNGFVAEHEWEVNEKLYEQIVIGSIEVIDSESGVIAMTLENNDGELEILSIRECNEERKTWDVLNPEDNPKADILMNRILAEESGEIVLDYKDNPANFYWQWVPAGENKKLALLVGADSNFLLQNVQTLYYSIGTGVMVLITVVSSYMAVYLIRKFNLPKYQKHE